MTLETLYYYYMRNRWMLRPDLFYFQKSKAEIDRPIFITGLQGSGATFVSRVLRRIDNVVTLSGNSKYWSGADEMQSSLAQCLPEKYSRLTYKTPRSHYFGNRRGWMYACNEQLPFYKFSELDYDESEAQQFRHIIMGLLQLNSIQKEGNRFLDKSQSYALKIPLIRKALDGHNPKFIAIIRNPYVACYRGALKKGALSNENIAAEFKIKITAEHWNNTLNALQESKDDDVKIYRIEDILLNFEEKLFEIAAFTELDLREEHFPNANDVIPYGSKRRERWFPLRKDINSKYLRELTPKAKEIIENICGDNIKKFGYSHIPPQ